MSVVAEVDPSFLGNHLTDELVSCNNLFTDAFRSDLGKDGIEPVTFSCFIVTV